MSSDEPQARPLSEAKNALLQRWRQGNVDLRQQNIVPTPFTTLAPTSIQQELRARRDAEPRGLPKNTIVHAAYVGTAIDSERMIDVLAALAERHETMRTTFEIGADQVQQRIGNRTTFEFQTIDLTSRRSGTSLEAAAEVCHDLAVQPMNIVDGPLGRIAVVRVDRGLSVLFIAVDHLIGDGYSLGIALLEASELYEAMRVGRSASLPRLEVQYRDYAAWQRRWFASEAWRPQIEYWRGQLHGLSAAQLPSDRGDDDLAAARATSLWFRFSLELSSRVRDVARAEGVAPFHILFGAYCLMHRFLSDQSDQEEVGIGIAFHNRLHPEVEPMVGYFANTVVIRVDMTGGPTARDFIRQLKETTTAAWTRQEVILSHHYVAEVEPGRNLQVDPLYRTFFVLQPPLKVHTFADGDLSSMNVETGAALFDLGMWMWDEPAYRGKLEWAGKVLDASEGERLRTAYSRLVEALLCRYSASIDGLIAASRQ